VAAGEDDKKKEQGKGFAGLSSLVSDVNTMPPPAAKKPATGSSGTTSGASRPASQAASPEPQPAPQQPYKPPQQPGSGSSSGKWWIGIAAVIGVLWLIGQSNKNTSSPAPAHSPPAQAATPSYSPPPAQPQVPPRPAESTPPVGQDLVFSREQIAYCVAEDIRMDGAKSAVDNHIDSDVDRFNALVADYNSRCSSFRYRRGALESVRSSIEPYRSQLYSEGQQRLARYRPQGSISTPTPNYATNTRPSSSPQTYPSAQTASTYVPANTSPPITAESNSHSDQATQSQSPLTSDERSSIELACIIAKSQGPAAYNGCVDTQLQQLASAPRTPSMASLSYDEKSAIELACITNKSEGAANYNRCLVSQIRALESGPRQPSMAGLTVDEKSAIELACITAKSEGAASYNRCLVGQLRELQNAPRTPSLNGLSYQEKSSIQLACITEKSSGAAAYNRCLTMQLTSIGR
jgi:hypothetical protein